ncbi:hypothetical protein NKH77_26800 [Streptomyces sp. M19]
MTNTASRARRPRHQGRQDRGGPGLLVGALVVEETDEILAITLSGGVIRTRVNEVRRPAVTPWASN